MCRVFDDLAALAPSSGEEPASPRHRAGRVDGVEVDAAIQDERVVYLISTQVLARRLREADAVSFALMAPCACRQSRYASRCVAEADLEEDEGLQQRCAAVLRSA